MEPITRREILCGTAAWTAMAGATLTAAAAEPTTPAPVAPKKKIVVFGAHPDDPESACGGTMALYADQGHEVVSMYLTRGEAGISGKTHEESAKIRMDEAEKACNILGARPVFLTQVDAATEINPARYDEVRAAIEIEKPDLLISHWPLDTHRDHQLAGILGYDAWLKLNRAFDLYFFEVESGGQTRGFNPTHYIDITEIEPRKKKACMAHKSQRPKEDFYVLHTQMHLFRGREAGVEMAEAFIRHHQVARNGL